MVQTSRRKTISDPGQKQHRRRISDDVTSVTSDSPPVQKQNTNTLNMTSHDTNGIQWLPRHDIRPGVPRQYLAIYRNREQRDRFVT